MTAKQLAQYFDHTLLKANAQKADLQKLCAEAKVYDFRTVMINPAQVAFCKKQLGDTQVGVGTVIGFPLGQTTIESKIFETKDAIANGASEIDYVINITELKERNFSYIEYEMQSIVEICREKNIVSKVILETCYLTDDEKKELCKIALRAKPDFIKTSTGFGTNGATFEDIRLMKSEVGDLVKVKASGGIRTLEMTLKLIDLGVERIGASAGVEIIETFNYFLNY